jgi:GT2 family glycosyltransferase
MSKRPRYSIIIPFHSNERLLRLCLQSILKSVPADVEKIVVINNQHEVKIPGRIHSAQFRIVRHQRNLGYSGAINAGASLARGPTLIFCDADTVYWGTWFPSLTSFHKNTQNIGLASSRLLDPGTARVLDFGVGFTQYNAPHPYRDALLDYPFVNRPRVVQAACSANMIIDATLFAEIGALDEALHNGYSDLDLCLRVNETGRQCWVVSDSTVFHRGNSAATHRDSYWADIKGVFAAKNTHRLHYDMKRYFDESLRLHKQSIGFSKRYLLIDLSSVVDRAWHHSLLREYVDLVSIYDYSLGVRDSTAISLIDHIGLNILQSRTALLYFVDRFVALQSNRMWCDMRSRKDDLVVDRNANVVLLSEVVNAIR